MISNKELRKVTADLEVQAMMFDMDIDWESLELIPKDNYVEPIWITRWREGIEGTSADPNQNLEENE